MFLNARRTGIEIKSDISTTVQQYSITLLTAVAGSKLTL